MFNPMCAAPGFSQVCQLCWQQYTGRPEVFGEKEGVCRVQSQDVSFRVWPCLLGR